MGLKFGTSGIRGLVTDLTNKEVYLLVWSFLKYSCAQSSRTPIATGADLRESSPQILEAVHRAITDFGCRINSCGDLPTPALAYYAQKNSLASIMVTGSHIPADRNGIKFYLKSGETLKQDDEQIFEIYKNLRNDKFADELFNSDGIFKENVDIEVQDSSDQAHSLFLTRYSEFFPNFPLKGLKVVIYQHSSVARDLLVEILTLLGANTIAVSRSETFIPVDTEAVESLELFNSWIKENDADALVSTDGDGDRPLIIDNLGNLIQGDKVGILTALYLNIEAIALPISCNSGVFNIPRFKTIKVTRIGSPYVVDALNILSNNFSSVAGFEANGGFILKSIIKTPYFLDSLPTRDSILPIISCLVSAQKQGKNLSDIVATLPARYTSSVLVKNCSNEKSIQILERIRANPQEFIKDLCAYNGENITIDALDGLRITTAENEVVHFRPSGNAPEFRCYTEASNQIRADQISVLAFEKITHLINLK